MKLYLAGRVSNGSDTELEAGYKEKFLRAEAEVLALGHVPVNPTTLDHNSAKTWVDYMVNALVAMLECDGIYALRDWRSSKGATIEVRLALRLGKEVIYQ